MYIPTVEQLRGLSIEAAECFGKPNVNAGYLDSIHIDRYFHNGQALCPFCGKPVTNAHHQPNRSKGLLRIGDTLLRPSLIGLCGSGTTGCHGKVHQRKLKIQWKWTDDHFAEKWWNGEVFYKIPPHSEELYEHGYWDFIEVKQHKINDSYRYL